MPKQKPITKVVFRKWCNGSIVALFPQVPSDIAGIYCSSYEHVGQHAGADYTGVVMRTTPATPDEYRDLAQELKRIGYNLKVSKNATYRDTLIRVKEAQKDFRTNSTY